MGRVERGMEGSQADDEEQALLLTPQREEEQQPPPGPAAAPVYCGGAIAAALQSLLSEDAQVLAFLYTSHFLTRWGSRMWEFAVALFMIEIWPASLLLTSLYGLAENLSVVLMGVQVGNWVDATTRLKVIQVSLATRNICVVSASLALVVLLLNPYSFPRGYSLFIFLVALVDMLGGISALAALATNIAIERDWVLVLAEERELSTITAMNSVMRGIDLSCKLLAPVVVGLIMSFISALAAAIFISLWSAASILLEYYLLSCVYHKTPQLHVRQGVLQQDPSDPSDLDMLLNFEQDDRVAPFYDNEKSLDTLQEDIGARDWAIHALWRQAHRKAMTILKHIARLKALEGWKVYAKQEMLLAAFSLSMLYFTVLSFGSLMTAALRWKGIPAYILGIARGVSALVGISATIAYPKVHARLHTLRTGLWSISFQWMLLAFCVASNWIHDAVGSSVLLMASVAASRFGLWMFDLAVLQLLQESVAESERGIVGGVQNSIQSLFEMMSFVVGIIISSPKDFPKLVLLSYSAVTGAFILYTIQVYRVRGHLLHIPHEKKINAPTSIP